MNKTIFVFFLYLFIRIYSVYGQVPSQQGAAPAEVTVIEFEKKSHDFGRVTEGGPVSYNFKFTNKGKFPLVVSNVKASCGCTTPNWPKDPVLPGQTGVITAVYNTINRPGSFNKNLTVFANTEPSLTTLTITGIVVPRVKSPEELYPKKVGSIRMFSDYVYLGKISTKEPVLKEVVFYNEGTEPVTFSFHELPAHIEMTIHPETAGPKEKATARISYNALKKNELGPVEDKVIIVTNQKSENKILLNIVADINEYYPPLSAEEAANAPKLSLSTSTVDMGTVAPQSSTSAEVEITNTGKQDLVLKKVRSGASYITVKTDDSVIKAGGKAKIKIIYKPGNKSGQDLQFIWIYSNDPTKPTETLSVKANVGVQ